MRVLGGLVLLLCCVAFPVSYAGSSDDAQGLAQRIKAAYLYKFASYVQWPRASFPESSTPLTIGVVGDDGLAADLEQAVVGHSVDGHPVAARRVAPGDTLAGIHILLIGPMHVEALKALTQAARQHSILTVGESADALDGGAVINFVLVDRHVRFEVSLRSAQESGLKLSARLLQVAARVHTDDD